MNTCYLCGGVDFSLRKGTVRDDPSMKIFECQQCGLVTLDSTDHIYSGFYESSEMHGENPKPLDELLKETAWDDQRRYEQLKPLITNKRILDFGCGAGGFLLNAKKLAAETSGVELEVRVQDHWSGSDIKIFSSIDEAASDCIKRGGYDVITAFHVLEHLSDPRDMLMKLGSMLSANGRMIVEVPSADDALITLYDCGAFQDFTYWSAHLFLFTASTLSALIKQAGLRVLSIQHYQRYPIANHLHWLSNGKPGGHQCWSFLNTSNLNHAYSETLASIGKTDTLIAHVELC